MLLASSSGHTLSTGGMRVPTSICLPVRVQGEAVLLEPLPALLSCVYRLTSTAQPVTQQQRRQPPGPGSLEGSEGWPGGVGNNNNEDDQELSTTAALKVCCCWTDIALLLLFRATKAPC